MDLNRFLRGYITCALWSSTDEHGEPLDAVFSRDDMANGVEAAMREDCADFIASNAADLVLFAEAGHDAEHAGHDFWLTRNGHGAGFWDRGLGELGERLTAAAKVYGGVELYVGDDGQIYGV